MDFQSSAEQLSIFMNHLQRRCVVLCTTFFAIKNVLRCYTSQINPFACPPYPRSGKAQHLAPPMCDFPPAPGTCWNEPFSFLLLPDSICKDPIRVKTQFGSICFPVFANLLNNFILIHISLPIILQVYKLLEAYTQPWSLLEQDGSE